jgi:MFS family permease
LSSLSDRKRKRWITLVLGLGSVLIIFLPYVSPAWMFPYLLLFGFFFLASFPTIEAALVQSVPDAVRGRVFGFYVMITGTVGALAPWMIGLRMKHIGGAAHKGHSYYGIFAALGGLGLLALAGLPCLHAIRKREHLDETGSELK